MLHYIVITLSILRSIQMGRIPVFLYSDLPWIPYMNSNISIETFGSICYTCRLINVMSVGFFAGMTTSENTLQEMVSKLSNVTDLEYIR